MGGPSTPRGLSVRQRDELVTALKWLMTLYGVKPGTLHHLADIAARAP